MSAIEGRQAISSIQPGDFIVSGECVDPQVIDDFVVSATTQGLGTKRAARLVLPVYETALCAADASASAWQAESGPRIHEDRLEEVFTNGDPADIHRVVTRRVIRNGLASVYGDDHASTIAAAKLSLRICKSVDALRPTRVYLQTGAYLLSRRLAPRGKPGLINYWALTPAALFGLSADRVRASHSHDISTIQIAQVLQYLTQQEQ